MRVGVIGSGDVGRALATGFLERGDEVVLGTRDPRKPEVQAWAQRSGPRGQAGTFAKAAEFGEIAVVATFWSGTENALRLAGADRLAGKAVIDVTNPLAFSPNEPPHLALGGTDSGGEQVQRWLPNALVVKAFNTITYSAMVRPQFPDGPPDMFICGNDAGAKAAVGEICTDFGWPPVIDIGDIEGARLLEPLAMLWIMYGVRTGTWSHAFKLLRH